MGNRKDVKKDVTFNDQQLGVNLNPLKTILGLTCKKDKKIVLIKPKNNSLTYHSIWRCKTLA